MIGHLLFAFGLLQFLYGALGQDDIGHLKHMITGSLAVVIGAVNT